MCVQVVDLEAHGVQGPNDLLKDELTQSLEELEALLKAKDEVKVSGQVASWRCRTVYTVEFLSNQ